LIFLSWYLRTDSWPSPVASKVPYLLATRDTYALKRCKILSVLTKDEEQLLPESSFLAICYVEAEVVLLIIKDCGMLVRDEAI
jgi:hypothetical protein